MVMITAFIEKNDIVAIVVLFPLLLLGLPIDILAHVLYEDLLLSGLDAIILELLAKKLDCKRIQDILGIDAQIAELRDATARAISSLAYIPLLNSKLKIGDPEAWYMHEAIRNLMLSLPLALETAIVLRLSPMPCTVYTPICGLLVFAATYIFTTLLLLRRMVEVYKCSFCHRLESVDTGPDMNLRSCETCSHESRASKLLVKLAYPSYLLLRFIGYMALNHTHLKWTIQTILEICMYERKCGIRLRADNA